MAPLQVARARNTSFAGNGPILQQCVPPAKWEGAVAHPTMSTPAPGPGAPSIGSQVRLAGPLPYLKTADPMPMLRPPDLVDPEEAGVVVECRPRDQLAVRFRRGTFLLAASQLQSVVTPGEELP